METPFKNEHAQNIAAALRHTVENPRCPTIEIDYTAWYSIKKLLFAKPIAIRKGTVQDFIKLFAALLDSISRSGHLAVTSDDLAWLVQVITAQDAYTLSLVIFMTTAQPTDDLIGLNEAAEILGHKSTSTLRTWIGDGRFFSAVKPGGRDWLLAKSELKLRNDM